MLYVLPINQQMIPRGWDVKRCRAGWKIQAVIEHKGVEKKEGFYVWTIFINDL
jgi:uncharacterized UBP type Zn finger protein